MEHRDVPGRRAGGSALCGSACAALALGETPLGPLHQSSAPVSGAESATEPKIGWPALRYRRRTTFDVGFAGFHRLPVLIIGCS
jgi:hypothetical protein